VKQRDNCRICESNEIESVINLGSAPLANDYVSEEQVTESEDFYPLQVYRCPNCGLVQLKDIVPAEKLFSSYDYVTGETSNSLPKHFQDYAKKALTDLNKEEPFIVGIGSNDGTLLKAFKNNGAKVLGIDPAENIAEIAEERGVETRTDFFNTNTAERIKLEKQKADVIVANNVLGHIDEVKEAIEGIGKLLKEDGKFFFEVPYLRELLDNRELDTIYHEHRSYYGLKPLKHLLKTGNLSMVDVDVIDVQGGSLRVKAVKQDKTSEKVQKMIEKEDIYSRERYMQFSKECYNLRNRLSTLITELNAEDKTIAGYGAPAKASVLLNFCNIGKESIDFVTDEISYKQGKYIPGTRIPIKKPDKFNKEKVDYGLMLAWNYEDEILEKESEFLKDGGKFIIPLPEPKIVGKENLK